MLFDTSNSLLNGVEIISKIFGKKIPNCDFSHQNLKRHRIFLDKKNIFLFFSKRTFFGNKKNLEKTIFFWKFFFPCFHEWSIIRQLRAFTPNFFDYEKNFQPWEKVRVQIIL